MRYAADLHIHSALSPCADDDMTPNNIVNMAIIKGLDIISIVDHNSCDNVEAAMEVAGDDIVVVPGIEVQTREEVHLLCYFKELDALICFDTFLRGKMPYIKNKSHIFGNQFIMDKDDNIIGTRDELLLVSVDIGVGELVKAARDRGGFVVPAHIDRKSFSIISQLGFIPQDLNFSILEVVDPSAIEKLGLENYKYIHSSDAHFLGEILEREMFLGAEFMEVFGI